MSHRPTDADPVPGRPDPALPMLFLHVPRTAGSMVKKLFQQVVGLDRSFIDVHRYELGDGIDPSRYAFVEGHLATHRLAGLFGPDWSSNGLTLMREPVSRVVSQARHLRARTFDNVHRRHLESVIDDPAAVFDAIPLLSNFQTRLLAGGVGHKRETAEQDLEKAKVVVDHLAFGTTDSVDASVALFAERFGVPLGPFGTDNASPIEGDDDLRSDAFRAEAARRNPLDLALYEHASALFAQRIVRYIDHLLDRDLDEGALSGAWRFGKASNHEAVLLPRREVAPRLTGTLLVDGEPPDAVLVRVDGAPTVVASGVYSVKLGRQSGNPSHRYAGVLGRVRVPADAEELEIVAFDRRHRRCASQRWPIGRRGR
jgi:hypothetical protein